MGKRDLLCINDLSRDEIEHIFEQAQNMKKELAGGKYRRSLEGRSLAMVFEKPSTRTRVGFEAAMTQLGGHAIYLTAADTQIGRNEPIKDTARILASYCDAILIRTFEHERVVELAKWSSVPVINGLSDLLHPCQILSDIFSIREHFGKLDKIKTAYLGDGNNVANSWITGAARMGMPLAIACPAGYDPDMKILAAAREGSDAKINVTRDPLEAVDGARVIYTDVWASMGQENEAEERRKKFAPYQVNRAILDNAEKDAVVMHCLPAHRGEEISEEAVDGPQSIVFKQAENRLHVQKAILDWLIVK